MNKRIYVFCFHRISDEKSPAYPPMKVKIFERICNYISKHFYIIPITEINKVHNSNKKLAVFTFDDGYYDFYENALPILVKYKIPAVQNIITSCAENRISFWTQKLNNCLEEYFYRNLTVEIQEIGIKKQIRSEKDLEKTALSIYLRLLENDLKDLIVKNLCEKLPEQINQTKMMKWNEIEECIKYNITIGSHTHTHVNLNTLDLNLIENELKISKNIIETRLKNYNCEVVAFPNGQYNNFTMEIAQKYGYRYLLSTEEKSFPINDAFKIIPRFSLYSNKPIKNYLKLKIIELIK